jgi:hypothetical protein
MPAVLDGQLRLTRRDRSLGRAVDVLPGVDSANDFAIGVQPDVDAVLAQVVMERTRPGSIADLPSDRTCPGTRVIPRHADEFVRRMTSHRPHARRNRRGPARTCPQRYRALARQGAVMVETSPRPKSVPMRHRPSGRPTVSPVGNGGGSPLVPACEHPVRCRVVPRSWRQQLARLAYSSGGES